MKFLKHVGKHNDRKVAVVFREVPDEPHMALVVYTELLNRNLHDAIVSCIESDIGQTSESLADALNRTHTVEGKLILPLLHVEGFLKKVNTELINMTPAPNVSIKLSELNKILDEMKKGEEAVKKLEEMDKSRGLQDPVDVARRMRSEPVVKPSTNVLNPITAPADGLLSDSALANNLRAQANRMEAEAKGLLAESQRLLKEAAMLAPAMPESVPTPSVFTTMTEAPRKAGRPKKAAKVAASHVT